MNNFEFKQLGNGSALNYKMTNSSFLIKNTKTKDIILFDVGNNVYTKLRNLQEMNMIELGNLKYIYISHLDDDHIGSLRSLLYYLFFTKNIVPVILVSPIVYPKLKNYLVNTGEHNALVTNYNKSYHELFKFQEIPETQTEVSGLLLNTFKTEHYQASAGLTIETPDAKIIITGDTLACPRILEEIIKSKEKPTYVFHDYSAWDEPSQQVHACPSNIKKEYPQDIIENLNYYHNDKPFISGWTRISTNMKNYKQI